MNMIVFSKIISGANNDLSESTSTTLSVTAELSFGTPSCVTLSGVEWESGEV